MLTLMASSETKVNNTLWTHYQTVRLSGWPFPGAYSSTLISLLELTPELSENPKACLLDKRGITLFFFRWPTVVLRLKHGIFVCSLDSCGGVFLKIRTHALLAEL